MAFSDDCKLNSTQPIALMDVALNSSKDIETFDDVSKVSAHSSVTINVEQETETVLKGSGAVKFDKVASTTATQEASNDSFETWTGGAAALPDDWATSGTYAITPARVAAEDETYAASLANGTAGESYIKQTVEAAGAWAGDKVIVRAKVKTNDANGVQLRVYDGIVPQSSSYHTGGGEYEIIEKEATQSALATECTVMLIVEAGAECIVDWVRVVHAATYPTETEAGVDNDTVYLGVTNPLRVAFSAYLSAEVAGRLTTAQMLLDEVGSSEKTRTYQYTGPFTEGWNTFEFDTNSPTEASDSYCIKGDGASGSYVEVVDQPIDVTNPFCVEFWLRVDHVLTADKFPLKFQSSASDVSLQCKIDSAYYNIQFFCTKNGFSQTMSGTYDSFSELYQWIHVALAYTPDFGGQMYINGVAQGNRTKSFLESPDVTTGNLVLLDECKMSMAELRVWNRERSAEEITADLNKRVSATAGFLGAYWKFNDLTTNLDEETGNSVDGVINGGITQPQQFDEITAGGDDLERIVRAEFTVKTDDPFDTLTDVILDKAVYYTFTDDNLHYAKIDIAGISGDCTFWEGRVMKFGTATRKMSEKRGLYNVGNMTISLSNVDLDLSNKYRQFGEAPGWKNKEVTIKVGFVGDVPSSKFGTITPPALADFATIYKGIIDNFDFAKNEVKIIIKDVTKKYFSSLPTRLIETADWTDLPDKTDLQGAPIIYGDVSSDVGALPVIHVGEEEANKDYYVIAGHACKDGTGELYVDGLKYEDSEYSETTDQDSLSANHVLNPDFEGGVTDNWAVNSATYTTFVIDAGSQIDGTYSAKIVCASTGGSDNLVDYSIVQDVPANSRGPWTIECKVKGTSGKILAMRAIRVIDTVEQSGAQDVTTTTVATAGIQTLKINLPQYNGLGTSYQIRLKIGLLKTGLSVGNLAYIDEVNCTTNKFIKTVGFAFDYEYDVNGVPYTVLKVDRWLNGAESKYENLLDNKEISVNIQGKTDDGTKDGTLITDVVDAFTDLLVNEIGVPTAMIDATSFAATKTVLTQRNQTIAGAIVKVTKVDLVLAEIFLSHNFEFYINKDGLFAIDTFNPTLLDITGANLYTDEVDIIAGSFDVNPGLDNMVNRIIYNYNYNYALDEYESKSTIVAQDSVDKTGTFVDWDDSELHLKWVRSSTVASNITNKLLDRYKYGRQGATFSIPFEGFNEDIANKVKITHYGAPPTEEHYELNSGASGWVAQLCRIREMNVDVDKFLIKAAVDNYQSLVSSGFYLGDGDTFAALWTDANETEKLYGYLADRTTGQFSNGDIGKKLS